VLFDMKPLFALVLLLAVLPATAADYPKKPDDKDKLCEVMGESSPNVTISPMDRLWFKENCTCVTGPNILFDDEHGSVGDSEKGITTCGNAGSRRFRARVSAVIKVTNDGNQKVISTIKTKDLQWKALEPLRDAFWRCSDAVVPGVAPPGRQLGDPWCESETAALGDACSKTLLNATQCRANSSPTRAP
jgi:hypothetical protein